MTPVEALYINCKWMMKQIPKSDVEFHKREDSDIGVSLGLSLASWRLTC
jgi:hypothetical protein